MGSVLFCAYLTRNDSNMSQYWLYTEHVTHMWILSLHYMVYTCTRQYSNIIASALICILYVPLVAHFMTKLIQSDSGNNHRVWYNCSTMYMRIT